MADRIGQQVGNYRILRLLGRGGQASVCLGEHLYLQSHAALKVLHTSLQDTDVQRFLSEAQTLVRLRYPHIVRVLDFAVEQGTPVLIMDYAPGGTVRERCPGGSCLPLNTVVAYVRQVAAALQYAHNRSVIHRDIKPENLLLGEQQQVLLSDFGLALLTPSPELLSTQEMADTLPYMAPEQIRGKPGFASDQYALGVVTYEWLCGARPFKGPPWEIVQHHLSAAPSPLREKNPALSPAVEEVVLRALAKDPEHRFVSVQAFAHALARASRMSTFDDDSQVSAPLHESSTSPFMTLPDSTAQMIFLSASPADEAFATRLKADLQAQGILAEFPGHPAGQQEEVRRAIRAAHLVVVVLSPHARSSRTVKEHLRIASLYERALVFVWVAGDEIAAVLPEAWGKTAVIDLIDARQSRYERALEEIVDCLKGEMSVSAPLEPYLAASLGEPRNPYKGLRAFSQDDATDFFGRDRLVQELVEAVSDSLANDVPVGQKARLLAVVGPSGAGKSSAVMAGLLPQLRNGALPGSKAWVYLEPTLPGTHPLESLALTLAQKLPDRSLKTIREDLEDDTTRGLHLLASTLTTPERMKVVLVVDQFEELFTQTTSEEERRHFLDLLLTAITEPGGPVIVILTLRADFYDRPMTYPELSQLIEAHQQAVLSMQMHDLRAVIEEPAALPDVQLTFEGNLVGDLLFEMQGQIGALPLLQFTLDQLFQRRREYLLTLQAYREIGGVKGALAKQAESTYNALPSAEHRQLARALFLRLIDVGSTDQDTTRRRAALAELKGPDPQKTAIIEEVAQTFITSRLLTTSTRAAVPTVEVSHEALIREWARLSDWVREAHEDIRLQKAISEDVAEWRRRGMPVDRLYRGTQLDEAQAWGERNLPSIDEVVFLQASVAERRQQEAAEYERRKQEEQHRKRYTRRMVLVGLAGLGLTVSTGVLVSKLLPQPRQTTSSPLPTLSLPYSYHGHTDAVESVAWAPDGTRLGKRG